MYRYYELAIMTRERRADLLREAERDRLVKIAGGRGRQPVICRAGETLVVLGQTLIRWGRGQSPASHAASEA